MPKRYNIFVSSVAKSLPSARVAVVKCILGLGHYPTEMSFFPASSRNNWAFHQKLIGECDYLVVLLAGLYGSGFVRKEVKYAQSQQIPIYAFLHDAIDSLPTDQRESNPPTIQKLQSLRKLLSTSPYVRWTNETELVTGMSSTLRNAFEEVPRRGWVPDLVVPGKHGLEMPDSVRELFAWNFLHSFYPVEFHDSAGNLLEDIRFDIFARLTLWILEKGEADSTALEAVEFGTGRYLYIRIYQAIVHMNEESDVIIWSVDDFINKLSVLQCLGIVTGRHRLEITQLGRKLKERWPEDFLDHSEQELDEIMGISGIDYEPPELDADSIARLDSVSYR
jgi:hypothetical protein